MISLLTLGGLMCGRWNSMKTCTYLLLELTTPREYTPITTLLESMPFTEKMDTTTDTVVSMDGKSSPLTSAPSTYQTENAICTTQMTTSAATAAQRQTAAVFSSLHGCREQFLTMKSLTRASMAVECPTSGTRRVSRTISTMRLKIKTPWSALCLKSTRSLTISNTSTLAPTKLNLILNSWSSLHLATRRRPAPGYRPAPLSAETDFFLTAALSLLIYSSLKPSHLHLSGWIHLWVKSM